MSSVQMSPDCQCISGADETSQFPRAGCPPTILCTSPKLTCAQAALSTRPSRYCTVCREEHIMHMRQGTVRIRSHCSLRGEADIRGGSWQKLRQGTTNQGVSTAAVNRSGLRIDERWPLLRVCSNPAHLAAGRPRRPRVTWEAKSPTSCQTEMHPT